MSFIHRLSSTLSAAFRPILSVLGMATQPEQSEIYSGNVVDWYRLVNADCAMNPIARERYKDLQSMPVHRIRRYKESSLSQHEYLVAEVIPKGRSRVYLQVERLRSLESPDSTPPSSPPSDTDSSHRPLDMSLASLNSTSLSSSSNSLKGSPARDEVKVLSDWPAGVKAKFRARGAGSKEKIDTIIEEMAFKGTTVYDLIVIAYTLHVDNPDYELLFKQCYWYANLIVRILARCDIGSEGKPSNDTMEAELFNADEGDYNPSTFSKWFGFPIHKARQTYLGQLEALYRRQRESFHDNVLALITKDIDFEMEKRRRAEETERAERQTERAERETERADMEKRLRAEETERADMEKRLRAEETERAERQTERAERQTERAERQTERAERQTERADMEKRLRAEETERAERESERADMEKRLRAEETKRAEEEIRQLRAQLEMERRGVATTT